MAVSNGQRPTPPPNQEKEQGEEKNKNSKKAGTRGGADASRRKVELLQKGGVPLFRPEEGNAQGGRKDPFTK